MVLELRPRRTPGSSQTGGRADDHNRLPLSWNCDPRVGIDQDLMKIRHRLWVVRRIGSAPDGWAPACMGPQPEDARSVPASVSPMADNPRKVMLFDTKPATGRGRETNP